MFPRVVTKENEKKQSEEPVVIKIPLEIFRKSNSPENRNFLLNCV